MGRVSCSQISTVGDLFVRRDNRSKHSLSVPAAFSWPLSFPWPISPAVNATFWGCEGGRFQECC